MTPSGRSVDLRANPDTSTTNPEDLAFDRPTDDELLEVSLDIVGELAGCGFSQTELERIAKLIGMAARTRRPGEN